jgi:hypothetical protein
MVYQRLEAWENVMTRVKLQLRRKYKDSLEKSEGVKEEKIMDLGYRNGFQGMIDWTEDFVSVDIYPPGKFVKEWCPVKDLPREIHDKTNKSYWSMWEKQKEILEVCLRMVNNEFLYRLIVLCWMRGEGKSLLACLIQLWKFFNWTQQEIVCGANSRDQVKFVHFDIMSNIIKNSPELYEQIGEKNLQDKEIRLKDDRGHIKSKIRSISSFSGIVSNITGYTFSEIFDMKNPRFFTQLDGSTRAVPNALGVIDSTVSDKLHVLYQLYEGYRTGKTKEVYFSHRYSEEAQVKDYWNPNTTIDQLNDYRVKFPFGEFERYFQNTWDAGVRQVFSETMVEEIGYIGIDDALLNHFDIKPALEKKQKLYENVALMKSKGLTKSIYNIEIQIQDIMARLRPVDSLYMLKTAFNSPRMATMEDLKVLTEAFDTHFAILSGVDFGDPYAVAGLARTILVVVAKGLPGSRSRPFMVVTPDAAPKYIYFVLHVLDEATHSLDIIKEELEVVHSEFDGIDTLCSERYGVWDVDKWCETRGIAFEPVFPTYDRQKEAFGVVLRVVQEGLYKAPGLCVSGSKSEDILKEEFPVFNHDAQKKWFGSTEKGQKYGVRDDFMFGNGWCLYGGRKVGIEKFRERKGIMTFGSYIPSTGLLGNYR